MGDDMEIDDSNDEIVNDSEDDTVPEKPESYLKRNYLDISSAAVASVRFGVSSTATAANSAAGRTPQVHVSSPYSVMVFALC